MPKIWIGRDDIREPGAADVCASSIRRFGDFEFGDLSLENPEIASVYKRTWHVEEIGRVDDRDGKPFSTDFSFSRFLVPYLQKFEGWALFCDGDILFRRNPIELFDLADDQYAVMCVKHFHRGDEGQKMNGQSQTQYFRKNWSSLVLWNCSHPSNRVLTPFEVNQLPGQFLHAFNWLQNTEIGALDEEWNWLVGASPTTTREPRDPKAVHFTLGLPGMAKAPQSIWDQEWFAFEKDAAA